MTTTSTPPAGTDPDKTIRPRDAATLVIVDRVMGVPRVLMGQRRLDQVFMPGKYVFPGGRVDETDRTIQSADELHPWEVSKLLLDMKGHPSPVRARALGMAALREPFEEAGLVIGSSCSSSEAAACEVESWNAFFACGFLPRLSTLRLFARAITPPGRPRRYDTRFFHISADEISHQVDTSDGELLGLHWLTIEDARSLDLPAITRVILEDLTDFLRDADSGSGDAPVPYYHHRNGTFRRELLSVADASVQLDTESGQGMVRPNSNERA